MSNAKTPQTLSVVSRVSGLKFAATPGCHYSDPSVNVLVVRTYQVRSIGVACAGALLLAHANGAAQSPSSEAICGYGVRFVAFQAGAPRPGLSVELLAGDAAVGEAMPLRFRVQRRPGDVPVDDLQVEHEKLMHVIGVRDDLGEFFHIHPQREAPGLWQVIHTFTNGGRYQIWSDVKERGTVYSFAQPWLTVTGSIQPVAAPVVPTLQDRRAGYEITLRHEGELQTGKTNQLELVIRDELGRQVGLEFFLGALMHLVIVKDDLSVCLHSHAENHDKSQRIVFFKQTFAQPGNYKLFAQFRPMKTSLPLDEAILAQFWVKVTKSN